MVVLGVYRYGASFVKVLRNGWVRVDPILCTNWSEKYFSSLSTKSFIFVVNLYFLKFQ